MTTTPAYPPVTYVPAFLTAEEAEALMAALTVGIPWEQHRIRIFGRTVDCPRLSAWYGDPGAAYRYSGIDLHPVPWTARLSELRRQVERAADARFNAVLLNRYRSGADSMGWHADDERELGARPVIASVSLGAERVMRFRRRDDHTVAVSVPLQPGSLLVMHGGCQEAWHHALPKTRRPVGERINLTFRWIAAAG